MTQQTLPDRLLCPFCGSNNISDGEVLSARDNGDTFKQSACLDCGDRRHARLAGREIERNPESSMTTEPKAEGVEAVGWVFQHDENGRMTFCPNDGVNTPEVFAELNPRYTLCSAAYTHPTPSAVEALARAAEGLRFDVFKVASPELRALFDGAKSICVLQQETVAPLRSALRHPEIAALLKEKES